MPEPATPRSQRKFSTAGGVFGGTNSRRAAGHAGAPVFFILGKFTTEPCTPRSARFPRMTFLFPKCRATPFPFPEGPERTQAKLPGGGDSTPTPHMRPSDRPPCTAPCVHHTTTAVESSCTTSDDEADGEHAPARRWVSARTRPFFATSGRASIPTSRRVRPDRVLNRTTGAHSNTLAREGSLARRRSLACRSRRRRRRVVW